MVELARQNGFRPVTLADLVPGFECLMVDDPHLKQNGIWGTTVRIDEVKPRRMPKFKTTATRTDPDGEEDVPYVFYHCVTPPWDGQCFVPVAHMIDPEHRETAGPYTYHVYWVKSR